MQSVENSCLHLLGRRLLLGYCMVLGMFAPATRAQTAMADGRIPVTVSLATQGAVVRPEFFGFNVEWISFQESALERTGAVRVKLVEALKVFRGAHYRYPGGTTSNFFEWQRAVGPSAERPLQNTPWASGRRMQFGIAEYLDFVRSVGGKPWYVLNVTPSACRGGSSPPDDCLKLVEDSSKGLASKVQELQRGLGSATKPWEPCEVGRVCPIAVWELGNETDHGKAALSAERYVELSRAAISGVRAISPIAYIVAHTATSPWDTGRKRASAEFNSRVISSLAAEGVGFAYHFYYDGISPASAISLLDLGDPKPAVSDKWVTEHAKWPREDPYTHRFGVESGPTNFSAALSNADFLLKLSRRSEVKGAMAHALDGNGPWPMFKPSRDGRDIVTTPVFDVLTLLRKNMVGDVVGTVSPPGALSGEVQAYRNQSTGRVSVIVAYRGDRDQPMSISLQEVGAGSLSLAEACVMREASQVCAESPSELRSLVNYWRAGDHGAAVDIPARSVAVLAFDRK